MTNGLYLQNSTTHELKPLQFNVSPTWETSLQRRRDEFQKASDCGASVCGLLIQGLAPTDFPLDGLLREVRPNLPDRLRQVEYLSAWDGPEMSRRTRKTIGGSVEFQTGLIQQVYLFGATGSDGRDKEPADRYTKTAELAGKCMYGTPAEVNRVVWRGHWADGFFCPNFASYWTAAVFHLAWRNVPPLMAEQFAWQGLKSRQLALDDNHPRWFSVIENLFDASVEAVDVLLAAWEARSPANATSTPERHPGEGEANKPLEPRYRKAYIALLYVAVKKEMDPRELLDRDAYDWIKENGIDFDEPGMSELKGWKLPTEYKTWETYVVAARTAMGENKNQSRTGRTGRSIVDADELD